MGDLGQEYRKCWDQRYQEAGYAYGKDPNLFFKEWLGKLTPGSILMPADGEGRNGVYAAAMGWRVTAVDLSIEGKRKALELAEEKGVSIEYLVSDLEDLSFDNEAFDAIALIYAHFSAEKKSRFHKKLDACLKPGGLIILEAYSKTHRQYQLKNPKLGGPKDIEMLYSKEEIGADLKNFNILYLQEEDTGPEEGSFHEGKSSVLRFVGRKPL